MKYAIYSVDDSRFGYIMKMKSQLKTWQQTVIKCVDGRVSEELEGALISRGYRVEKKDIRVGQLGVWHTFLNALDEAPIVTFDDDALLCEDFVETFESRLTEMPADADFFSLFLARDSDNLYHEGLSVSERLSKAYLRYGGASFYFTERGRDNIHRLVSRDGIFAQYDDQLYSYVKSGELNGYCSKPYYSDLVYITGNEMSIAQGTEIYSD